MIVLTAQSFTSFVAGEKNTLPLPRVVYKATGPRMKGVFQCLLVALCSLNFALTVHGDDSDFIDEKGRALRHLKGKMKYMFSQAIPPCGSTRKRKPGLASFRAIKNTILHARTHFTCGSMRQFKSTQCEP